MCGKITRRLATALISAPALAQTQPAPEKTSEEDLSAAARKQTQANAEQLVKYDVPMAAEPAIVFKA